MAMTKTELRKAERSHDRNQLFTCLLLVLGSPAAPSWQGKLDKYDEKALELICDMTEDSVDETMVLWHFHCWCQRERREGRKNE